MSRLLSKRERSIAAEDGNERNGSKRAVERVGGHGDGVRAWVREIEAQRERLSPVDSSLGFPARSSMRGRKRTVWVGFAVFALVSLACRDGRLDGQLRRQQRLQRTRL
jgi:hypothetical protein